MILVRVLPHAAQYDGQCKPDGDVAISADNTSVSLSINPGEPMKNSLIFIAALAAFGSAHAAVNVNTATQEELQTLKGITAAKAKAIIDYRSKAGSFKSTDDLEKVEGVNARFVDMQQLRKDITLTGPTSVRKESQPNVK
jgi:competence protein ComEA